MKPLIRHVRGPYKTFGALPRTNVLLPRPQPSSAYQPLYQLHLLPPVRLLVHSERLSKSDAFDASILAGPLNQALPSANDFPSLGVTDLIYYVRRSWMLQLWWMCVVLSSSCCRSTSILVRDGGGSSLSPSLSSSTHHIIHFLPFIIILPSSSSSRGRELTMPFYVVFSIPNLCHYNYIRGRVNLSLLP
jgi:hypothetical protein